MVVNFKVTINGTEISDVRNAMVNRSLSEQNTTSTFNLTIDSPYGRHAGEFTNNNPVLIYADQDADPTTLIFAGIVENISFDGEGTKTTLRIEGRDYGAVMQDVIVYPRIFKEQEVSVIVNDLMAQNISPTHVTTNNVDVTTTTVDKITFSNISVWDAINQLAEIAGFIFYVDENQDLHFEEKDSASSGETLDNINVLSADFRTTNDGVFNKVTVQGDRQLTGANQVFVTDTDNTGSVYILDDKPHNPVVTFSGTTNTIYQPGGVVNINDPTVDNVKYLVDFQGRRIILTSGIAAGDNTLPTGSILIVDYQRSTPVISIKQAGNAFPKHKVITDRNIKDIQEAALKAQTFLNQNVDPKVRGRIELRGVLSLTPGNTVVVNLPDQDQTNKTYALNNVRYNFNPVNNQSDKVVTVDVNRRISSFIDVMKEQILRLRVLESSETDSSITQVQLGSSVVGVTHSTKAISTSIGSGFFFHTPGHDILNSPTSLLGDMRGGSVVFENGSQLP